MEEQHAAGMAHACSTTQLRGIARQIQARPDDLDLFVEGIVTYHIVIEGVLAMTGQHQILKYLSDHEIYPGLPSRASRWWSRTSTATSRSACASWPRCASRSRATGS